MSNWEFGLTLTVFGMGGTLVILFLISLVMDLSETNAFLSGKRRKSEWRKWHWMD